MSDNLISKDKLFNSRPEWLNENMPDKEKSTYNKGWNACNNLWLDTINEQPTIDAVEVVRCNDCVNHRHCITEDAFKIVWIEDGFCKVGKLKGANNE